MMKRAFTALLITASIALACTGQALPQFNSESFDGWIYNNPGVELTKGNIAGSKVVLYVNSQGLVLTLTSPPFSCQGIDTIKAEVKWITRYYYAPQFHLERTALTLAIDNGQGIPMDSITCTPTTPGTSTHWLQFAIPVPTGLDTCQLRFVSWNADVNSCGAVNRINTTAVTSTTDGKTIGDLDGDGSISVSDVTDLITLILYGTGNTDVAVADVDQDGSISVSDVTRLIERVLNGH